jgi:hypothetical protein
MAKAKTFKGEVEQMQGRALGKLISTSIPNSISTSISKGESHEQSYEKHLHSRARTSAESYKHAQFILCPFEG